LPGIVNKELFSSPIFLTEIRVKSLGPLVVQVTELAVLVTLGIGLPIFVPKELKGYSFPLQFLVKIFHRGHLAFFLSNARQRRKEKVLQRVFI
jgi:hypothetical protein